MHAASCYPSSRELTHNRVSSNFMKYEYFALAVTGHLAQQTKAAAIKAAPNLCSPV